MNHPENIIYVVLIVGSIIWSIAKKFIGKKDSATQSHTAQTQKPQKSLEDIFRELAGEIEPHPILQNVESQPMLQEKTPPVVKPQIVFNDALAQEKHILPRISAPQELPQRIFAINLENVSDWQNAFVYSEVFNRKY